jgi:metallophosphoesterase superfamily enzyme
VILHGPRGFVREGVGFLHGHTWPDLPLLESRVVLMAHSHPTVWFTDRLSSRSAEPCWLRASASPRMIHDEGVSRRIYPPVEKSGKKKSAEGDIPPAEMEGGDDGRIMFKRPPPRKRLELVLVPAMSPYGQGCAVNHRERPFLGPLGTFDCVDIPNSDVYLLNGVHLGKVRGLPEAKGEEGSAMEGEDGGKGRGRGDDSASGGG